MKNAVITLLVAGIAFLGFSAISGSETPFAQLSSLKTQIPTKEASAVKLETTDGKSGIDVAESTKVTIKDSGSYFIMASGQVGAQKNASSADGYVDLWLIQNDKNVANSNTRQYISQNQFTAVLVSQAIISLNAGDTISVGYSASKPSLGLVATEATAAEPAIPSIIFSIYKI